MCQRIECPSCHRPGYVGCGDHVEQVLGDVPPAERCQCSDGGAPSGAGRAGRSWLPLGRRTPGA